MASAVPRLHARVHPPFAPSSPHPLQHKLQNEWTMWELRKKDREAGLGVKDWSELPLSLYSFSTVEDFWQCWKRTPQITCVGGGWGRGAWWLEGGRRRRGVAAAGGGQAGGRRAGRVRQAQALAGLPMLA